MGHRINERIFWTKEEAEEDQKTKGTPGYSEVYPRGISPCKAKHPETGEPTDAWKSTTEVYSG